MDKSLVILFVFYGSYEFCNWTCKEYQYACNNRMIDSYSSINRQLNLFAGSFQITH